MSDLQEEFKQLVSRMDKIKSNKVEVEARLNVANSELEKAMKELSDLGYGSLDEAQEALSSLNVKINKQISDLKEELDKVDGSNG